MEAEDFRVEGRVEPPSPSVGLLIQGWMVCEMKELEAGSRDWPGELAQLQR